MAERDAKLKRTAKGKRPQYFADPATDKLLSITLTLAGELSVLRERVDTLERLLERDGAVSREQIDQYQPDERAAAERETQRSAYLQRILRAVQMELEEVAGADMPESIDEVLGHLS